MTTLYRPHIRGLRVQVYQFHFYDPEGRRPMLDFVECEDDGGAARQAFRELCRHGSCVGVEVFEDDRLVARVERPVPAFMTAGIGMHGVR